MDRLKKRLIELVREVALYKGEFILTSGKKSNYYLDVKKLCLHPEGLYLVTNLLRSIMGDIRPFPNAVGGPVIGADPIVGALVYSSYDLKRQLMGFLVRKGDRTHGMMHKIEGLENIPKGSGVVLLEDVLTTGASLIPVVDEVLSINLKILGVMCVIDREEGGRLLIERRNIPFYPLLTIKDVA